MSKGSESGTESTSKGEDVRDGRKVQGRTETKGTGSEKRNGQSEMRARDERHRGLVGRKRPKEPEKRKARRRTGNRETEGR